MLSRIAESLYWIGRYVQRAESSCRILDVHLQLVVEDPTVDVHDAAQTLLGVMGYPSTSDSVSDEIAQLLLHDLASPSVVSAIAGAREAARRARETVPPEMWEAINTTWHAGSGPSLRLMRPSSALNLLRERCAVINGTADSAMSHDEGWLFLELGRGLEQVDMTARTMMLAASTPNRPSAWTSALRARGALHAYRRTYGAETLGRDAAGFLLLDGLFPGSVVHSLRSVEEALTALEPGVEGARAEGTPVWLLGKARAELEYQRMDEVLSTLPERLTALQHLCVDLDAAISERYFEGAASPTWKGGAL